MMSRPEQTRPCVIGWTGHRPDLFADPGAARSTVTETAHALAVARLLRCGRTNKFAAVGLYRRKPGEPARRTDGRLSSARLCAAGQLGPCAGPARQRFGVVVHADEEHLRQELSGVLCRCTGYVGIVRAVQEVATAHPEGLPAPKQLGRPITGRQWAPSPGEERALEAAAQARSTRAAPTNSDLSLPEGEPNQTIDVTATIAPSPEETWELIRDFARVSGCMPGLQLEAADGEDTYMGHVQVHLGPMKLSSPVWEVRTSACELTNERSSPR